MTFALTGSDTQGIINLRNLLSRIALVVEPGQPAALTIQLDLMQPAPEPSLIYLDAFDSEIDVEILKWLSYHPLLTPALQRNTGQVATAELIRLVYPESLRQAVHTQTYVALATWVKHQTSAPSAESPLAGFSTVSSARRKTLARIAFWIIQKLAKYAGVTFPFACMLLAMAPLVAQERVDPPGAGQGGGNVNLTQIGGVNVGAGNGLYVRPGTGAQFDVNVLNATLAVTQSGTWSVRLQDSSGNGLASSTSAPAGTEQALIVRNIPSGTQPVSGTITVGTFPDNEPFNLAQLGGNPPSTGNGTADTGTLRVSIASNSTGSVSATQSGTWSVRAQDGAGNALASATTNPAGTEQGLIVRNIPSGTQPVSGTVTANAGTGTFTISGAVTQSGTWSVRAQDGTGTISLLPAASTAVRIGYPANTAAPTAMNFLVPIAVPANNALCVLAVATNTLSIQINGYTAP